MKRKRLEKLRDGLRAIKDQSRFDMNRWGTRRNTNKDERQHINEDNCGTAGCALGWATGIFSQKNFYLKFVNGNCGSSVVYRTNSGIFSGYKAGEKFFGITDDQADYLFYPGRYGSETNKITPEHVIAHIDNLLSGSTN